MSGDVKNVHPCRYDFVPPVKYDYLKADEAEKKFEQRYNTLNYFSVMLSKKLREQEGEEGEGRGVGGEGEEGASVGALAGKKKAKKKEGVSNLVRRREFLPQMLTSTQFLPEHLWFE